MALRVGCEASVGRVRKGTGEGKKNTTHQGEQFHEHGQGNRGVSGEDAKPLVQRVEVSGESEELGHRLQRRFTAWIRAGRGSKGGGQGRQQRCAAQEGEVRQKSPYANSPFFLKLLTLVPLHGEENAGCDSPSPLALPPPNRVPPPPPPCLVSSNEVALFMESNMAISFW